MSTYAIGDIQGCYDELVALLDLVNFDTRFDRIWLTGDLVNRGPKSLAVLELVESMGDSAVVVLGNHDLHLLVCGYVDKYSPKRKDTFQDVLGSPKCAHYLDWLRNLPLLHHDEHLRVTMVHAGLPPFWTINTAITHAREVESKLRGDNYLSFLKTMYGNQPDQWDPALTGNDRLRLITNYFTRLRYLTGDGRIDFKHKGPVGSQPAELVPWYEQYRFEGVRESIVFGHWSALHLSAEEMRQKRIFALDTGAVWGRTLTAMRLEDRQLFSVPSNVCLPMDD